VQLENIIKKTNKFGKIKFFFKEAKFLPTYKDDKFHSLLFPEKLSETKKVFGGARYNSLFKNSLNGFPLISIIMPNFKEKNISKSIDSILKQNYPNIELIIIDGNSGDETINILKEYGDDIDIWVSEKDKNLWDAWNKGFLLSRGDFVGIVDSSNILYPNSLDILIKYIFENKEIDFLCGTVKKDNKIYAGFRPKDIFRQFNIIPSTIVGFYIKLTSLRKVGLLNISYKIQSDYDWLYRIIVTNKMKGIRTKGDEVFGDLGESKFSSKVSFFSGLINELKIRLHNKQSTGAILFIFFGRIILNFYKKIMKIIEFKK
jgi:glycosyltransferase involved in cell wall biosynthesis